MDRLTENNWQNLDPWECCGRDKYCQKGNYEPGGYNNGCLVPKLYSRLAAYEDTGFTPEEVIKLKQERDALIEQVPHDPEKQGQWISVNDRLPKAEERVLVCVENKYAGKTYKNVVTGMHEDGTVYREDSDWMFNDFDELRTYDEEKDDWIIPEGWWEYTLYNEENENYIIDGNVTHWMPIPEPPQEEPHEP